jgi:hypothetical protein
VLLEFKLELEQQLVQQVSLDRQPFLLLLLETLTQRSQGLVVLLKRFLVSLPDFQKKC